MECLLTQLVIKRLSPEIDCQSLAVRALGNLEAEVQVSQTEMKSDLKQPLMKDVWFIKWFVHHGALLVLCDVIILFLSVLKCQLQNICTYFMALYNTLF